MSDGLPPSMTELLAPPAQPESSVLTEQPQRQVNFLTTGVPPPADLYVSPMDSIRVELFTQNAGIPALVKMRYVRPDGEIQYEEESLVTVALPASTLQDYPIGEAFLLSVAVISGQSSTQRGRIYANVSYIRAFGGPSAAYMHTLVQGYVTQLQRVSWPIIQADYPLNGPGLPVYNSLAAPGAGNNAVYTVPTNIRVRLMSMYWTVTTSATVGNRYMSVIARAGGAPIAYSGSPVAQTASGTLNYTCGASLPSAQAAQGIVYLPWPVNLLLSAGDTIEVDFQGVQTGDTITVVNLALEEWVDM